MNDQDKPKNSIIAFSILEGGLVTTGLMSIQYWRDCFMWGHFCTHSPIEALLKLYCGISVPVAVIFLLMYRLFLSLPVKKQWVFASLSLFGLLVSAQLYYQIYIH